MAYSQALILQESATNGNVDLSNFNLNVAYGICQLLKCHPKKTLAFFQQCQSNLHISYRTFKKYLAQMQQLGLVELCLVPTGDPCGRGLVALNCGRRKTYARKTWQLTEKGKAFLGAVEQVYSSLFVSV